MHGILSTGAPTNGEGSDVVGQIEIRGGHGLFGQFVSIGDSSYILSVAHSRVFIFIHAHF